MRLNPPLIASSTASGVTYAFQFGGGVAYQEAGVVVGLLIEWKKPVVEIFCNLADLHCGGDEGFNGFDRIFRFCKGVQKY